MNFAKFFVFGKGIKPLVQSFGFVILIMATFPAYADAQICPAQLQQEITKIIQFPKLQAARVGVFVQTNEPNPQVLVNIEGDRYFMPASNVKIFTTAIALKKLSANHRFHTQLLAELPNTLGEIQNGLWLLGAGDPSFSSATGLKSLVTQLKKQGVKRISGGIGTTTIRKGSGLVGSWEWSDLQEYYAAIASPFTINENSLTWTIRPSKVGERPVFEWEAPDLASDWRVENNAITIAANADLNGSFANKLKIVRPYGQKVIIISGQISEKEEPEDGGIAVPDPEANFLQLLGRELINQGIETAPISKSPQKRESLNQLANWDSPPISQLVFTINKESNNLYAELLLRALGEKFYTDSLAKSLDKSLRINPYQFVSLNDESYGLLVINEYLKSVGVAPEDVLIVDGSGLSRRNLTKPRTIAQFLQIIDRDRDIAPYFRKSLPIAGVDGSLRKRFQSTNAQGIIQAKTGTLIGAIALSGYTIPKNYREVVFSIMINNSNLSAKQTQEYVDAIALTINSLDGKQSCKLPISAGRNSP